MSQPLAPKVDISPSDHGLWVLDAQAIIHGSDTAKSEKGAPEVWVWHRGGCRQVTVCVCVCVPMEGRNPIP